VIDLPLQTKSSSFRIWVIRWLLFFLISLGLGYAAVQRYDPRQTEGLSDAAVYYRIVINQPVEARELRFRVLVPYLARPFYALANRFLSEPRSVYLALLIANSIFCATSACLIVLVGLRLSANPAIGLLGATLYLLNFAVTNLYLPAMIDAGEAFALLGLTVTLLSRRWRWVPIWGALGAVAKETFVPIATVFALTWWFVAYRKHAERWRRLVPVLLLILSAAVVMIVLRLIFAEFIETSAILEQTHASGSGFGGRLGVFFSPTVWYVFIWLLPLGAISLNKLPRPWVVASILAAVAALILGMYRDIGGNVARPLFSILGPILSLSTAMWLIDPSNSARVEILRDSKS
jgi:hypothetical protein